MHQACQRAMHVDCARLGKRFEAIDHEPESHESNAGTAVVLNAHHRRVTTQSGAAQVSDQRTRHETRSLGAGCQRPRMGGILHEPSSISGLGP